MAIIFGGDTGIRENAFAGFVRGITDQFASFANDIKSTANNLLGNEFPIHLPKETVYVDDGFQNVPGTAFTGSGNISSIDDVKTRRITTQTPDATVYVKKRVFWSLRNEHDSKFMGSAEKLFMRASKLLFERKCSQIAAYEAMTKLEKFTAEEVELDTNITPELQKEGNARDLIRAIQVLRKEKNLVPSDTVGLLVETDEVGKEFINSVLEEIKKPTNVSDVIFESNDGGELKIETRLNDEVGQDYKLKIKLK